MQKIKARVQKREEAERMKQRVCRRHTLGFCVVLTGMVCVLCTCPVHQPGDDGWSESLSSWAERNPRKMWARPYLLLLYNIHHQERDSKPKNLSKGA